MSEDVLVAEIQARVAEAVSARLDWARVDLASLRVGLSPLRRTGAVTIRCAEDGDWVAEERLAEEGMLLFLTIPYKDPQVIGDIITFCFTLSLLTVAKREI